MLDYSREYYQENRRQYSRHRLKNKRLYRVRNKKAVFDYLSTHPCVDCGEDDPTVLEFDHVRGTKIANVAQLACDGASQAMIKSEVAKCEVRCANCHRRKTAQERNYKGCLKEARE